MFVLSRILDAADRELMRSDCPQQIGVAHASEKAR